MKYPKIQNIYKRDHNTNKIIEHEYTCDEFHFLRNNVWRWREKIDGMNIRVIWDGYKVSFAGRTDNAKLPGQLVNYLSEKFGGDIKEELFEQRFGDNPAILFGEGCGPKIQSGGYYTNQTFVLFDVAYQCEECDEYRFMSEEYVDEIGDIFNLDMCNNHGAGKLDDAVEYVRSYDSRGIEFEGLVCVPIIELRNRIGDRIVCKIKKRDFI